MGVSHRQFTREFKLAVVRRLEAGVSLAEVCCGLEVNPSVLQRWRREFHQAPGKTFPGERKSVSAVPLLSWQEGCLLNLFRINKSTS